MLRIRIIFLNFRFSGKPNEYFVSAACRKIFPWSEVLASMPTVQIYCLQESIGLGFYLRGNVAPYSNLGDTVARGVAISPEPDELRHTGEYRELMLLPRCLTLGQDAVAGIRIIHRRGILLTGATGKKIMCWKDAYASTYLILFFFLTEKIYRSSLGRYKIIYHSVHF